MKREQKREPMRDKESARHHDRGDSSGRLRRKFKPRKRPTVPLSMERELHSDGYESDRMERIEADKKSSSTQGYIDEAAAVTEEMD